MIVSPLLARDKHARFEGMGFILDKAFDQLSTDRDRWTAILTAIPENVVSWYQEDIYSKKLGALFGTYVEKNESLMGELLVLLVMARQRPPGWEKAIERFIQKSNKNSFYLYQVFALLRSEFRTSFSTERTRQQLRRFTAMAVAKHQTGAKSPNVKLIEKVAKALEENEKKREAEKGKPEMT
jgi:hypothetical protein